MAIADVFRNLAVGKAGPFESAGPCIAAATCPELEGDIHKFELREIVEIARDPQAVVVDAFC